MKKKNVVKIIQTAGYNGVRTVHTWYYLPSNSDSLGTIHNQRWLIFPLLGPQGPLVDLFYVLEIYSYCLFWMPPPSPSELRLIMDGPLLKRINIFDDDMLYIQICKFLKSENSWLICFGVTNFDKIGSKAWIIWIPRSKQAIVWLLESRTSWK